MKTFRQHGDTVDLVAPSGGVTSGVPVLIGTAFAIPVADAAQGEIFAGQLVNVHELPKKTGAGSAFTVGALAYWDAGNGRLTPTDAEGVLVGFATVAAADGDATAFVRLSGTPAT